MSANVGIANSNILTGNEIKKMSDAPFLQKVVEVNVFAEIEPSQKEKKKKRLY